MKTPRERLQEVYRDSYNGNRPGQGRWRDAAYDVLAEPDQSEAYREQVDHLRSVEDAYVERIAELEAQLERLIAALKAEVKWLEARPPAMTDAGKALVAHASMPERKRNPRTVRGKLYLDAPSPCQLAALIGGES